MKKSRKNIIPPLKKIDHTNIRNKYKLSKSQKNRRVSVNERIKKEQMKTGETLRKAAINTKKRFNVLRIYRKYKNPKECKILTEDMKYIDNKYGLNMTNNIC
tara:strand:- start:467 stop:772 length:306 start_codon:yes stop_codon:yes gene_type:complete